MARRRRLLGPGTDAVAEVIGTFLLVGITVALAAGFGVILSSAMRPVEHTRAELFGSLFAGADATWGSGDEEIRLRHVGGADVPSAGTTVFFETAGIRSTVSGDGLGGAFADGRFRIGETWSHPFVLSDCQAIEVGLVVTHRGGTQQLLTQQALTADSGGCP